MWLGEKAISNLRVFLDGFWTHQYLNGIDTPSVLPFWLFEPYIHKYYGNKLKNKGYSWNQLILLKCKRNESQALDKFIELFDEFQKIKPSAASISTIKTPEIEFFKTQNNIYRIRIDENRNEVDYGPAERIYIIEYSNDFGCVLHYRFNNLEIDSKFYASVQDAKKEVEREYGDKVVWETSEANAAFSDLHSGTAIG